MIFFPMPLFFTFGVEKGSKILYGIFEGFFHVIFDIFLGVVSDVSEQVRLKTETRQQIDILR